MEAETATPTRGRGRRATSFIYTAKKNFNVSQNIDTDSVVAGKFDTGRRLGQECGHPGPMPRTFLTRHVHVAETDARPREEAESHLATDRDVDPIFQAAGQDLISRTRIGYGPDGMRGNPGTPERAELRRIFQERSKSYDFWIDNGLALVGSPDTVTRKIEEQVKLIGHDIFCAQHRFGHMAPETAKKSIRLFAEEVMPAFA